MYDDVARGTGRPDRRPEIGQRSRHERCNSNRSNPSSSDASGSRAGSPLCKHMIRLETQSEPQAGAPNLSYLFSFVVYTFGIGRIFVQTVID